MAKVHILLEIDTAKPGSFNIERVSTDRKTLGGRGVKKGNPSKPLKMIPGMLLVSNPTICYYQGGVLKCITY